MRIPALITLALLVLVHLLGWATGAGGTPERQPADRILAVVDDDPILASEVQQILSFGLVEPREDEDDRALQRRALDFLIEVRLRFHEVDRFGFAEVPIDAVDEQMESLRQRFGGEGEFRLQLEKLGLNEQGARQILARQVMVWVYVEERLGARVFVGLEDIQKYYDEILVPQLVEQGEPVPAIQEVREPIRTLLHEQLMNEELERWTTELLQQADVEDFFDSRYDSLPPVVFSTDKATE